MLAVSSRTHVHVVLVYVDTGYCWVDKYWNTMSKCLERLRMRALVSFEGFSMDTR